MTTILFRLALLALALPVRGESQDTGLTLAGDGELTFYDTETQNGTVAVRTYRDEKRRITKEIFHRVDWDRLQPATSPAPASSFSIRTLPVSYDPKHLVPTEIRIHDYLDDDRPVRTSTYWSDYRLRGFSTFEYAGNQLTLMRTFSPTGRRISEQRDGGRGCAMHFDRTGNYVVQLRGQLPSDERWAEEWGPEDRGLRCRVDDLEQYDRLGMPMLTVSLRNTQSKRVSVPCGFSVERVHPRLCTMDGKAIPIDEPAVARRAQELERTNPNGTGRTIALGIYESCAVGTAELREWYPDLRPGRYRVSLSYKAGNDLVLDSNEIQINVLPDSNRP
jgi:hypothetical protein